MFLSDVSFFFFFQAEDGIRDYKVTGVQTCALPIYPIHRRLDERLEFGACVAVHSEVAAERVAHLGLVTLAAGVLPEHEDVPFTAQLVDAGPVMARHGEDEVGRLHQLAREQPRAVSREIEPALQPDEVRALGHRGPVPRARPGGRDIDPLDGPLGEGALQQRRREGAAANVAGAHQQDLCRLRHLGHGASRPAARRSSRSEEHTSELQSPCNLVCRLLLEKKKKNTLDSTRSYRNYSKRLRT